MSFFLNFVKCGCSQKFKYLTYILIEIKTFGLGSTARPELCFTDLDLTYFNLDFSAFRICFDSTIIGDQNIQ